MRSVVLFAGRERGPDLRHDQYLSVLPRERGRQRDRSGSRVGQTEETLDRGMRGERRGHEDGGERGTEHGAHRARRVEAHEREPKSGRPPLDDTGEVRPVEVQNGGQSKKGEVQVEDGILGKGRPACPASTRDSAAAGAPTRRASARIASAGGVTSAIASPSGSSSAVAARIARRSSNARNEVPEEVAGLKRQAVFERKRGPPPEARERRSAGHDRAGCAPRPRSGWRPSAARRSGGAWRRPARRRSCSPPRLRRRAARARAALRTDRPPRAALPRRRRPDPDAGTSREGVRGCWSAPSSRDSSWRSGRSPRGRGSGRSRTSSLSRGPGGCGTHARSWPSERRPPSSAAASWT